MDTVISGHVVIQVVLYRLRLPEQIVQLLISPEHYVHDELHAVSVPFIGVYPVGI